MRAKERVVLLLLSCVGSIVFCDGIGSDEPKTLVLVHAIYRHGQRAPLLPYPNDPYKDESLWPNGFGELTEEGKQQHFLLGQWLGRRYSRLFPEGTYSADDIYIRSTDVSRTIASAKKNIQGFNTIVTPIESLKINTVPVEKDNLMQTKITCPKFEVEFAKIVSGPVQDYNKDHVGLYKNLTELAGWKVTTIVGAAETYDTLLVEAKRNLSLPKWTSDYMTDVFPALKNQDWSYPSLTTTAKRLFSAGGGSLIKAIIERMKLKIDNKLSPDYKLVEYSGHDFVLQTSLRTLNVKNDTTIPDFASAILIELLKNEKNEHFVQMFYKKGTEFDTPEILKIPECSVVCPFEDFIRFTKDVIPRDWTKECTEGVDPNAPRLNITYYRSIY